MKATDLLDRFLKLSIILLLFIAIFSEQTKSFYDFLKWYIFGAFFYLFIRFLLDKKIGFSIISLVSLILFNPLLQFNYQRETWILIDCFLILFIIFSFFPLYKIDSFIYDIKYLKRKYYILFGVCVMIGIISTILFLPKDIKYYLDKGYTHLYAKEIMAQQSYTWSIGCAIFTSLVCILILAIGLKNTSGNDMFKGIDDIMEKYGNEEVE